jgi:WD40 repeat protein
VLKTSEDNAYFSNMKLAVKKIGTLTGHSGAVYSLSEGPREKGANSSHFFTGSSDKFLALWNLETLQAEKFAAQFPSIVYAICHVPEKKLLLVGTSAGSIHILDLANKTELKILQHHTSSIFDLKYSVQTNCFYSAGGDGNFAICSLETLSMIQIKKICAEKVRSIAFNYHNKEIALASGDCNIRIFDLTTLEEKKIFVAHTLSANCICYSPDGALILTGGRDAHLNIWDAKSYTLIKSIPAHNFAIYDIVFSPDAKLFATASRDKTIKIWDAETFELQVRINKENFEGHVNSVNKLMWTENYLLSTGDDRSVMVWEVNK